MIKNKGLKKIAIIVTILVSSFVSFSLDNPSPENCSSIYGRIFEKGEIKYEAFQKAVSGYSALNNDGMINNDSIMTIIDFDQPSTSERLFVIDLKNEKILYKTLVAHGKNSGNNYAEKFSNTNGSHQSSLGFYLTGETYYGKYGLSLRLDGLEKGINDKARERAVVMHAANYVSDDFIKKYKRLGRSFGCPAIPFAMQKKIIPAIKNKSLLYIHKNSSEYEQESIII
ncbi:murein L,D-transpeptidase catalytic domain family protein [Aureibacter tunicatorum]|uniref:L,D-transpeptidase catalytic domain n=1 Tax=Aureibacter tunicatorum TaxID=866807 RepID=A0AAE3XLX7_9BACT|nr:murein L,D-transpeptidase catalytic domain family protein [Aureibacter tunicatorum]MDR6238365.1 hypothetical protein [Aureibacter tunicatorum]BDD03397.1 hypothetical protein AUTU_08800 [Aureibacter tunicatorum]